MNNIHILHVDDNYLTEINFHMHVHYATLISKCHIHALFLAAFIITLLQTCTLIKSMLH